MSYDFAIWKRSATTKTAMLADAYDAMCHERGHAAVDSFDVAELSRAIQALYGGPAAQDAPFVLDGGSHDGSSWLIVNCTHPAASSVRDSILDLVLSRGLLLYDPQRAVVWGNTRPAKN